LVAAVVKSALSSEDRAILALESPTVAGHTCKVIALGPPAPGIGALRAAVESRLDAAPALKRRLGGTPSEPEWVPDDSFDIEWHVVEHPEPLQPDALAGRVAGLFAEHLDRARPLWRLDVLRIEDGSTTLVWRIHHALADGTATMRFVRTVLCREAEPPAPAAAAAHEHAADDARRRAHLGAFIQREFARSRGGSPFDGRIGTRRHVAFAEAPLHDLHDAAKRAAGATLNDAVLASVAGGLRRWIEEHHGRLGDVRVKVPVSLHHEGDDAGNRDSFFSLGLPLNEPDPVARLCAVHAATSVRKAKHDAEEIDELTRRLSALSPALGRFCDRLEHSPRRFALNVSNVPGPRDSMAVLDAPVRSMHSLAEIGERHALRVSVVSFAGTLYFGLLADPALVDGLESLADGVEMEAAALIAAG
jgi:diacylglycerol O-acyltransferase / wax synthase